jgi:hypothetical protein
VEHSAEDRYKKTVFEIAELLFVTNQLKKKSITDFILMIKVLTDTNVAFIKKGYVGNFGFSEGLTQIHGAFSFLLDFEDWIPLDFF